MKKMWIDAAAGAIAALGFIFACVALVAGHATSFMWISGGATLVVATLTYPGWEEWRDEKLKETLRVRMLKNLSLCKFKLTEQENGSWFLASEDSGLRQIVLDDLSQVKTLAVLLLEAARELDQE